MKYGESASQGEKFKLAEKSAVFAAPQQSRQADAGTLEPKAGCIAGAMAIIGQKWTALILRDLAAGPQRFAELERSIDNLNPRTLSRRLDELEDNGVICRCHGSSAYELTEKGRDLIPVLEAMAAWGDRYA